MRESKSPNHCQDVFSPVDMKTYELTRCHCSDDSSNTITVTTPEPSPSTIFTVAPVSQIADGQVQGGMHTVTVTPVSHIGDGQIQNPARVVVITMMPAFAVPPASAETRATDEQTSTPSSSPGFVMPTKPPTVIEQACGIASRAGFEISGVVSPVVSPVVSASDVPISSLLLPTYTAPLIPSNSNSTSTSTLIVTPFTPSFNHSSFSPSTSAYASTSIPSDSFSDSTSASASASTIELPSPRVSLVSCLTNSTLRLTLSDGGVLRDSRNRTGYIAANYQFQFDGPPQAGAVYTAGWSVCPVSGLSSSGTGNVVDDGAAAAGDSDVDNGDSGEGQLTLALGGNTTFWQCLSGDFYNLYTEDWAAQCSPVQLRVVGLVDCTA